MLNYGDQVGIVACSNALPYSEKNQIEALVELLTKLNLIPVLSDFIYNVESVFSGTPKQRADVLMKFYSDQNIKAIFDISGGDISNSLLDFLDYRLIRDNPKPFWGYSDLTTIINAIYQKTENHSYLYQIKNLVRESKERQIENFKHTVFLEKNDLNDVSWKFVQGFKMSGIVIGGNIRCFLKLAGTSYMPDFKDKILFLESYSGGVGKMTTYMYQLNQLGAFKNIAGLLLGTFTEIEKYKEEPNLLDLVLSVVDNKRLPIAKTSEIGHSNTSKYLVIGQSYLVKLQE